jgi:hypothetical protein
MSFFEKTQGHPVITGTVCFLFLAGGIVGGILAYKKVTGDRARQPALRVIHEVTDEVRSLEVALEKAKEQLRQSGSLLNSEDRIKLNGAVVIVDENRPVYYTVLSNACASLERNDFEFFRTAFDHLQQSNVLHGLRRDRQYLEQVIQVCKQRAKAASPPSR